MFKNFFLLVLVVFFSIGLYAQTIFINEIHYDNAGGDENEGVEIAASAGLDLSCYELHFYNGSNSSVYGDFVTLSGVAEDQSNGFGFIWTAVEGLQNGSPDGLALYNSCDGALIQFLSYEGMIAAIDGPANGSISENIGVEESGSAESGTSLQLSGTGATYTDFVWSESQASTYGAVNTGQSFGGGGSTTDPSLNIFTSNMTVSEDAGEIEITMQAVNIVEDFTLNIDFSDSAASLDYDFSAANTAISISAANGADQTLTSTITVIDDEDEEETETITINFGVDNENVSLNKTTLTITIEDNDGEPVGIPEFTIAEVTGENEDGTAESFDVQCKLTGVVQGINLFEAGRLLFTMHDGTAGIGVFNNDTDFGYTVTPGDQIMVEGTIGQFRGLTQIAVDTITFVSSDNALQDFKQVSILDESTESENVFLTELSIVDASQWLSDGSFNVEFTTQNGDAVLVRIDNDTPLSNLPFSDIGMADASFEIYGIGGQFDSESPYDSGYQLFPMKVGDIRQVDVGIEEITFGNNIEVLQTGNNNFIINAPKQIQNVKAFEMNGKEIVISVNGNKLTLNSTLKGLYLVTFEMDNQIYSTKISIN